MTDQQIKQGVGPTPSTITVQGSQQLLPKLAYAHFDGSGAGADFLPVIKFIGPGGQIAGQAVGDVVTAGASVDQTWFRGLAKQTGGSGATAREQLGTGALVTVPGNSSGNLKWSKVAGATLLDLTTPASPKIITSGVYSVTVTAQLFSLMTVGAEYRLQLATSAGGYADAVHNSPAATAAVQQPFVACTIVDYFPAGRIIFAEIFNFDSISLDFGIFNANVQLVGS